MTLRPQRGNPRPRIFRIDDHSLRNQMGFPSFGAEHVKNNIISFRGDLALGVNIGPNKESKGDQVLNDFVELYKIFFLS